MAKRSTRSSSSGSGAKVSRAVVGSATRMRCIRTRDVRETHNETDGVQPDRVHR